MALRDWFLTAPERANPVSELPGWASGNLAEPLIHGAAYFDRLVDEVDALEAGDHLFFADWRGDPDQRLRPDGPTVAQLFARAARRGVVVKGLIWRSHLDALAYSEEENRNLSEAVSAAGGEDADLLDPADAVAAITAAAEALQRWYDGGRVGRRPPGRLRPHRPERLRWYTRAWALPAYRLVYDPDGRPLRARRSGTW